MDPDRRPTIQGVQYEVKVIAPKRLFGTRLGWDEDLRVEFSDPARTIVDTLDDPAMGGGIRQVADTVQNSFGSRNCETTNACSSTSSGSATGRSTSGSAT